MRATPLSLGIAIFISLLAACGAPAPDPALPYQRAVNAFAEQRFDLARVYYADDLAVHSERPESLRGLALSWLSGPGQSLEPALPALKSYLELIPEDDEMRQRYVRALLLLGDGPGAADHAAKLKPGLDRALLLAKAWAPSDPQRAWEALESCRDSNQAQCQARAAAIAHQLGKNALAREHAELARQLDPLRESNWYLLGRLRLSAGDRDGAQRALEVHEGLTKLARGGPKGSPLSPIESLRWLEELAKDLPPDSPPIRRLRVRLQLEAGFIEEALAALPSIVDDPLSTTGDRLALADLLLKRGEGGEAEALFRKVLEVEPRSQHARAGLVSTLLAASQLEETRTLLTDGLEVDPTLARYHVLSFRLERAAGNPEAARQSMSRALDLAPWSVPWRLELATFLVEAGDRLAAAALLDEADGK